MCASQAADDNTLLVGWLAAANKSKQRRKQRKQRVQRDFQEHASELTDEEFRRFYRVTRTCFVWLHRKLQCLSPKRKRQVGSMRKRNLQSRFVFLLGGATLTSGKCGGSEPLHSMTRFMWCSKHYTSYLTLTAYLYSLNEILEMPDAPKNEHLSAISKEFACLANGLFVGCIWCIDGLCIRIQRPPESKVSNPARCYNRKGFFALSMQGVCDARRRIRSASVICPGNLHHYSSGPVISFCLFGGCSYRLRAWFTGV